MKMKSNIKKSLRTAALKAINAFKRKKEDNLKLETVMESKFEDIVTPRQLSPASVEN